MAPDFLSATVLIPSVTIIQLRDVVIVVVVGMRVQIKKKKTFKRFEISA